VKMSRKEYQRRITELFQQAKAAADARREADTLASLDELYAFMEQHNHKFPQPTSAEPDPELFDLMQLLHARNMKLRSQQ
jgi:hypothetical protein